MQKLTTSLKRALNKNQQELYKAEYITEGLELSAKGRNSYINNLFLEEGDHKKAVQNMVDECKELNSEE